MENGRRRKRRLMVEPLEARVMLDVGGSTIAYDVLDNVSSVTDERGQQTVFQYDDAERLTSINGPGEDDFASLQFDGKTIDGFLPQFVVRAGKVD